MFFIAVNKKQINDNKNKVSTVSNDEQLFISKWHTERK